MTDKKKKILNIIRIVIAAILIFFFVIQIVLGITAGTNPEAVSKLPFTLFEITSDSMYPTLKSGDGIIEVESDFNSLKTGDIITFYSDGEFVTHRVISVNGDGTVTTRGEANTYDDAPINVNAYVGKVVIILPGFSGFLALSEGWRKIVWIAVIIFVLFAPEIIFKISEAHRDKKGQQIEKDGK